MTKQINQSLNIWLMRKEDIFKIFQNYLPINIKNSTVWFQKSTITILLFSECRSIFHQFRVLMVNVNYKGTKKNKQTPAYILITILKYIIYILPIVINCTSSPRTLWGKLGWERVIDPKWPSGLLEKKQVEPWSF